MSQDIDVLAIFSARRYSAAGGCYNNDVRRALKINLCLFLLPIHVVFVCVYPCIEPAVFWGLIPFSGSFRLSCTSACWKLVYGPSSL